MNKNSSSMVNDMVRNDPEVRKLVESRLAARVATAQSELERALKDLKSFSDKDSEGASLTPVAPVAKTNRGRPSGSSPGHSVAILLTLKNKHNGMKAADIVEILTKKTSPIDHKAYDKTIRTYLSKMTKDERLVKVGENPTLYKLASKKPEVSESPTV